MINNTSYPEHANQTVHILDTSPKLSALKNLLNPLLSEGLIVAFSGGVDSSFLLWSAIEALKHLNAEGHSGKLLALLTISPSIPVWEIQEAKATAAAFNAKLIVINSQELEQEAYLKNDGSRCYYCKSELFKIARQQAQQQGYRHIAYGYNASDRQDVRFGRLAAEENNIHAPLDKAGLTKEEIRSALKQIGLSLADKPASPCLASRIMTGVPVTAEKLGHIEKMEAILRNAGLQIYRVRVHEEKAGNQDLATQVRYFRIEVAAEEMPAVLEIRNTLVQAAKTMGYRWVNLDLSGYRQGGGTFVS